MSEIIKLVARPPDAPCCIKLESEDGSKSVLIQTDWDWPGVASNFGFLLHSVQKCDRCHLISTRLVNVVVKYCRHCPDAVGNIGTNVAGAHVCDHYGTDGTIDCVECGVKAGDFISAARVFIDEHDGATCENPGYELTK